VDPEHKYLREPGRHDPRPDALRVAGPPVLNHKELKCAMQ
jgi:hypothetical protein